MYGNMTREEMIQRLYEGNFTTGELERQLIAKLFEQCCGGGSGSSGGGVYVVNATTVGDNVQQLDKTAAEIWAAAQSSMVIVRYEGDITSITPMSMARQQIDGSNHYYSFTFNDTMFSTDSDSGYPSYVSTQED